MRPAFKYSVIKPTSFLLFALMALIAGCSLEKQNGFNRGMQNLTAHYNILFNAKEILRLKEDSYATAFVDNYNEILSVYQDTTPHSPTPDKDLDLAIAKANNIITFKEQSQYLGDAYLLLGRANYLQGNYYNAVEYFGYVTRSFRQRKDLMWQARVWKTRTLLYLNQLPQAKVEIDSAIQSIDPKKKPHADIFAAKLQYDIDAEDYADGEEVAKLAVKYCNNTPQRTRWTFILAQLQEMNNHQADAYKNYAQIAKSNALFEMAFNASLNMIRIEDTKNGVKTDRVTQLLALLKDPNDKEFKDQIYYQVAQIYLADKKIDDAIKYYKLSLRSSVKNQSQKGLAYLRLAEIYFSNKADYLTSKKYYDSTVTTLPPNFPGYQAIQKKGSNLQLLADRLQTVAMEDTLQALAKMDDKKRALVIDKMVSDKIIEQQAIATANAGSAGNAFTANNANITGINNKNSAGGTFYFDNAAAVGQGYSDFKRTWGNRKLEDNWRRANRPSGDVTSNTSNPIQGTDPDGPVNRGPANKTAVTATTYRKQLIEGLPLTPTLLAQSNQRVYNAYVDIANFYRDVLDDKPDAIATFETILRRFPDDPNKPAIYYSLYRLYADEDIAKSDLYKNKLLKEFPETPFAKVISDPDYSKKLDDANAEFTAAYNVVFGLYEHKEYKEVLTCVPELMKLYPDNKLSAQLYYLQTIAQGHLEKVGTFRDSLQQVLKKYPNDRLIAPLANQHLAYINTNLAELQKRDTVLAGANPNEVPFAMAPELQEKAAFRHLIRPGMIVQQQAQSPVKQQANAIVQRIGQTVNNAQPKQGAVNNGGTASSLFSMRDSTNYYFVINVATATTNLASSRFGIGQFNRANYAGKGIKHDLAFVNPDNQLIFVGRFYSLEDAKAYARQIIPLMPDIMKVPKDKYSFFIITQENLNKLADKKTLDSYVDYYQQNY